MLRAEVGLQSSNTIYDIVSPQKKEVLPAKDLKNLLSLEACIDDSKIVPVLRSQRNAKLIDPSLKCAPSTEKDEKKADAIRHCGKSSSGNAMVSSIGIAYGCIDIYPRKSWVASPEGPRRRWRRRLAGRRSALRTTPP